MDGRPLTGLAAAEAIGVYVRLGETDSRFNARFVAAAVQARALRRSLFASLSRPYGVVGAVLARPVLRGIRTYRRSVRRRLRALRRGGTASERPPSNRGTV